MKLQILAAFLLLCCAGCSTVEIFEKNVFVPEQQWNADFKPEISFDITDTTASYNIFFVFRHTDAFGWNNIWVRATSQVPGDSTIMTEQFDFPLTSQNKWTGSGMDDIYEHRILFYNRPVKFRSSGKYTMKLEHIMRENPLPHVLNVGLRVEKAKS